MLAAVRELAPGGHGLVALDQLGQKLGTTPSALHAAVVQLWRAGKVTVAGAEGRHGSTEEERRWWMPVPGENEVGFVVLR